MDEIGMGDCRPNSYYEYYCEAGECKHQKTSGNSCDSDNECKGDLSCSGTSYVSGSYVDGVCTSPSTSEEPLLSSGGSCESDNECSSGTCLHDGSETTTTINPETGYYTVKEWNGECNSEFEEDPNYEDYKGTLEAMFGPLALGFCVPNAPDPD